MRHEELLNEQEAELMELYHNMTRTDKAKMLRLGNFILNCHEEAKALFERIGWHEPTATPTMAQIDEIDTYLEEHGQPLVKWLEAFDELMKQEGAATA